MTTTKLTSRKTPLAVADQRVGIVAGWGGFPLHVAKQLRANNCQVVTAGLKGHVGAELIGESDVFRRFGVLKLGAMLKFFRKSDVQHVVFAGKVFKDRILHRGLGWLGHMPDVTCVRVLGGSFITRTRDARDDTLLSAITNEFVRQGMPILTIHDCAPDLLVEAGTVGEIHASRNQMQDVDFGWSVAKQMGGMDIGQSIVVKDQMVIAVEAVEGTDALVKRSAQLCPRGGFTLVKVAKPEQDMRFDVPTIGVQTIRRMAECGGKAIAIDANKTIMVDRQQTIRLADQLGIAIVALRDDQIASLVPHLGPRSANVTGSDSFGDCQQVPRAYPYNRYRAA